jgi:hypothetical protein
MLKRTGGNSMRLTTLNPLSCLPLLLFVSICVTSCGGGSGGAAMAPPGSGGNPGSPGNPSPTASVTVTISDPAVCGNSVGGPFQHIYVTITDVQAFTSATSSLQGGVDLTPNLAQHPVQIDLLGAATNCVLATLASSTSVPTGTYQQLAVSLAGSNLAPLIAGGTKCGNMTASCAILPDGSVIDLDPTSTGSQPFGIPAAQIAGGQVTLSNGSQALNIDFDSCASMFSLTAGYGMDPTIHAALMPSTGSISGKLLDANTQQPISGDIIVALEVQDSSGIDREIMQTAPGPDGSFVLCPLPQGTYDVVAAAVANTGISYAATITTGVQPGDSLGNVLLQPAGSVNQAPASISGRLTANMGPPTNFAGYTHVVVSALQSVARGNSTVLVTIPLPSQHSSTLRTFVTGSNSYQLEVPAANPRVGAFVPNGTTTYLQDTSSPPAYQVELQSSCRPASVQTQSAIAVAPGSNVTAPLLALSGCPPA